MSFIGMQREGKFSKVPLSNRANMSKPAIVTKFVIPRAAENLPYLCNPRASVKGMFALSQRVYRLNATGGNF
jgi:hypothetical protein